MSPKEEKSSVVITERPHETIQACINAEERHQRERAAQARRDGVNLNSDRIIPPARFQVRGRPGPIGPGRQFTF